MFNWLKTEMGIHNRARPTITSLLVLLFKKFVGEALLAMLIIESSIRFIRFFSYIIHIWIIFFKFYDLFILVHFLSSLVFNCLKFLFLHVTLDLTSKQETYASWKRRVLFCWRLDRKWDHELNIRHNDENLGWLQKFSAFIQ